MTEDLLELARAIAERAAPDEAIEAYAVHERNFDVKAYEGEVESLSSAEPRGAGVRILHDHRIGFAYTTDLTHSGIAELLEDARDNVRFATRDEALALPEPWDAPVEDVPGLEDPGLAGVSPEQKVAFAIELDRATRGGDARIRTVEESIYADSASAVAIATSTGISGGYRRTDAWCYSIAIAEDDGQTETGFEFDLARGIAGLDPETVARRAAERAVAALGASKIDSARMPVVFDPYVAGQFLGVLGQALTGEAVQKGRSLFAGRLGQRVAGERLSLVDDGRAEGAPASAPWDDEGVPTRRTPVIAGGVLGSFLYDTTSARREGRTSTGNASRAGFKSGPHPAPTNLAFEPTGESPEDLWRSAGRALLVHEFHGVHSGANAVTGDFSVGATGVLLEGGAPGRPVSEVTIAAPMLDILGSVQAVAGDRRWLPFGGSYGGATTLIAEMTVGGR